MTRFLGSVWTSGSSGAAGGGGGGGGGNASVAEASGGGGGSYVSYSQAVSLANSSGQIASSGMSGFSEKGEPDEWDMAVGEVYGYRWWKLNVDAKVAGVLKEDTRGVSPSVGILTGANGQEWHRDKNEAVCTAAYYNRLSFQTEPSSWHAPPEFRVPCGCGFWAYFDKNLRAESVFYSMTSSVPYMYGSSIVQVLAFGVIKGTGRVIIGDKGFRSQYAEIVGLALPPVSQRQLGLWISDSEYLYDHGTDIYGNPYTASANTVHKAFMQAGGYTSPSYPAQPATSENFRSESGYMVSDCSEQERNARLATVEASMLQQYPGVKVFSDTETLVKYFPPDKNYAS